MLNIHCFTIPHSTQRYPTVGDYFEAPKGVMQFRISNMKNKNYEFLVFLHELIEQHLTFTRGISEDSITEFDIRYEENRNANDFSEPGNNPDAPYHKEHVFATQIEKLVANELGVDWDEYDKVVCSL